MRLPDDFVELMRQHYGAEVADGLCRALVETEPEVSVRLNPLKSRLLPAVDLEPVPWCPDAYYIGQRPPFTFDPLFHAGAYYVQEAGSMYLATVLERHYLPGVRPDGVVLDLCAAPGGKSTLLRSMVPMETWLFCNEPMGKRAQVLAENMIKWGYPRTVVTQNYPADYRFLSERFDLVVADVPCSGEGMFRKDEVAVAEWSLQNVELCWRRQRDIIADVWPTLRPGGLLVYSTCTFNRFEDEDNVAWIATHLGAEVLEQRHFLPGRDRGEGFFIAALRKDGQPADTPLPPREEPGREVLAKVRRNLRVLFDGIPAPEQKGKGLVPHHSLAMSVPMGADGRAATAALDTYPRCELTYNEALAYLRHEVLRIDAPRGIVLVTYRGVALGFVKNIGSRANNLYPQEWRIRSGYTTPYSLFPSQD